MENKNQEQVNFIWKPLCIIFAAFLTLSWVFFGFLYSKGGVDFSSLEVYEPNFSAHGGAVLSESSGNGIRLMRTEIPTEDYAANDISPLTDTAYTLTATITPANTTNTAVDWTIRFSNTQSAWANGKTVTDYVTVTPTSDGALTANVECKQAFGEQIVVTVTSRDNAKVKAECTVDYLQKVKKFKYVFADISTFVNPINYLTEAESKLLGPIDFRNTMRINDMGNFEFSEFTISRNAEVSGVIRLTNDFVKKLKKTFSSYTSSEKKIVAASWADTKSSIEFSLNDIWSNLFAGIENNSENNKKIADICSAVSEHFYFEISMKDTSAVETFTYHGGQFAAVNFVIDAESVDLNYNSILF